jgi:hypothetical protein
VKDVTEGFEVESLQVTRVPGVVEASSKKEGEATK